MAVTIDDVVALPGLGLRVAAGAAATGRAVRWVHVSELADPTPWLQGGELLLTTAMRFAGDEAGLLAYVDLLADAGLAGLGIGVGLTLAEIPPALAARADARGLPLLEIPRPVPFLAIAEAVSRRLAAAEFELVSRAYEAQRALTAAALPPGGPQTVATALAGLLDGWVLVTGVRGEPLASAPPSAQARLPALRADLVRAAARGLRASAAMSVAGQRVEIQPLGATRLHGFVVVGRPAAFGQYERLVVGAAASLLTIAVEGIRARTETERRMRASALDELLAREHADDEAARLADAVGVPDGPVRIALALPAASADDLAVEVDAELALRAVPGVAGVARTSGTGGRAAGGAAAGGAAGGSGGGARPGADDPVVRILVSGGRAVEALLRVLDGPLASAVVAVGVGEPVPVAQAARSLRQARQALAHGRSHGQRVTTFADLASSRLLLDLADPDSLGGFADAMLRPLDEWDRAGRGDLVASLAAFLAAGGTWEAAAAQLGVHRHTLRHRMRRVEQLTGRRLDAPRDRYELWLALEARDVAGAGPVPQDR